MNELIEFRRSVFWLGVCIRFRGEKHHIPQFKKDMVAFKPSAMKPFIWIYCIEEGGGFFRIREFTISPTEFRKVCEEIPSRFELILT